MQTKERYSYSKIDTYNQCQYKFKIKYVDKHYISGSAIALDFGTLVHETEETIANALRTNTPINYIELKNKFILKLIELEHKFPADFLTAGKSGKNYKEKGLFYLNTGIYRLEAFMRQHPTYKILGAEVEFNVDYGSMYYFYGKIDRLLYDTATNKYIIHDIKTYDTPLEKGKLATPLQFVVYTMAVMNKYNVSVNDVECAYDIPLCDVIQVGGTPGFLTRGKIKLDRLFNGIETQQFEPCPSPLCAWCEYSTTNKNATEEGKYLCPYHSNWIRGRETFAVANIWQGLSADKLITEQYKASNGQAVQIQIDSAMLDYIQIGGDHGNN